MERTGLQRRNPPRSLRWLPAWLEKAERLALRTEREAGPSWRRWSATKHKAEPGQPAEDYNSRWGCVRSYSLNSNMQK